MFTSASISAQRTIGRQSCGQRTSYADPSQSISNDCTTCKQSTSTCRCFVNSSYFARPPSLLENAVCENSCQAPITVQGWVGYPGATGSTGTCAPLNLCDNLILYTLGTMEIDVRKGSVLAHLEAAQILCGPSGPPTTPLAPSKNFAFFDTTDSSLFIWPGKCGITGWMAVDGSTGTPSYDFWRDSVGNPPNAGNANDIIHHFNDILVGVSGNMLVGNSGEITNTIVGAYAMTTPGTNRVAFGYHAGRYGQGFGSIAIGAFAGETGQQGVASTSSTVAIGYRAGQLAQKQSGIAIGFRAGGNYQGVKSIAIGFGAGLNNQSNLGIAIGNSAGGTTQGLYAIALGSNSGLINQGKSSCAFGNAAGQTTQGDYAIAFGHGAGNNTQGTRAIAIGKNAGQNNQGIDSITVGANSTSSFQTLVYGGNTTDAGFTGCILLGNSLTAAAVSPTVTSNNQLAIKVGSNEFRTNFNTVSSLPGGLTQQYIAGSINGVPAYISVFM